METIKDVLKSLSDRLSSPISGTFILAWIFTNWKISLTVLFGAENSDGRIARIENILRQSSSDDLIIIPGLFTLAYIAIMPLVRLLYGTFIDSINYVEARQKMNIRDSLQETGSYRSTLKGINAVFLKELKESKVAYEQIETGISHLQEDSPNKELKQLLASTEFRINRQRKILEDYERFEESYVDEIPNVTRVFLKSWQNISTGKK